MQVPLKYMDVGTTEQTSSPPVRYYWWSSSNSSIPDSKQQQSVKDTNRKFAHTICSAFWDMESIQERLKNMPVMLPLGLTQAYIATPRPRLSIQITESTEISP